MREASFLLHFATNESKLYTNRTFQKAKNFKRKPILSSTFRDSLKAQRLLAASFVSQFMWPSSSSSLNETLDRKTTNLFSVRIYSELFVYTREISKRQNWHLLTKLPSENYWSTRSFNFVSFPQGRWREKVPKCRTYLKSKRSARRIICPWF